MTWRAYIFDTMSGRIRCPIDLPSFSWSLSVSDSAFSTTRDKNVGEDEADGLRVPWAAVPARSAKTRADLLCPMKRGIMLCWSTSGDESDIGRPVVGGVISPRTDTPRDTSFSLMSPLAVLANRYLIRADRYGANGVASDVISYRHLSLRGLACAWGQYVTEGKDAGGLPIDWPYLNESGAADRDYHAYDIQNLDFKSFLTRLTNLDNGPDCQFRPYLSGAAFRWRFTAGSDSQPLLGGTPHMLVSTPAGGTIEDLEISHLGPTMRVYATGAGSGEKMKAAMVEDLTLVRRPDPWPLAEASLSDNDVDDVQVLASFARGQLNANRNPLMQFKGKVYANDTDASGRALHAPGSFWPGEPFTIGLDSFPTLPDGNYSTRLMQVTGDETDRMTLTFDIMTDPMA